jgi:HJR/Mrr/RecB family endonuclease
MEIGISFISYLGLDIDQKYFMPISRLLSDLPSSCREVMYLSMYEGLSVNEIAASLGIHVSTVRSQKTKGIRLVGMFIEKQAQLFLELIKDKDIHSEIKLLLNTSDFLMNEIARDENVLWTINSRQFEELIANILYKMGFEVNLTNQTHDGGTDIIVKSRNMLTESVWFVECKHRSLNHPIGINVFREVYGVHQLEKPNKSLIVTSSYFTKGVMKKALDYKNTIDLKDHKHVLSWISILKDPMLNFKNYLNLIG